MLSRPEPSSSLLGNAQWLLRLRWVAIVGQLITIAVVVLARQVSLEIRPLLSVVGLTAATNLLLHWWLHRKATWLVDDPGKSCLSVALVGTMVLDLLSLTALLYFSGGPTNPFTVFYFVNLALGAILLPAVWSWALTGLAIACFASFFLIGYRTIPELETASSHAAVISVQQQGLIAAFAACAIVNCYFITRVSSELQQREAQLRRAEQRRAQSERLEALATLAAGAGHELASPLSTIAVIANDLTRHLEGTNVPASVVEDVSLIRSELAHCRSILDRMSGSAGQAAGEQVGYWTLGEIVNAVIEGLRRSERVHVAGLDHLGQHKLFVPLQGLAQALRGLVQNAIDASGPEQTVEVSLSRAGSDILIRVVDRGQGMTPEELARAGEPFFTTKETGQGMGLGLFLTRNVIERLGGELRLQSTRGYGTTAEVQLPTRHNGGLEP